jgi:hypothetical protein
MSESGRRRLSDGAVQGAGALLVATAVGATVVISSWGEDVIAGRLALVGVLLFSITLGIGSARMVGATSIPVLGSALIASATADATSWPQSILIGIGWYVAMELAWDSIERRRGSQRSSELDVRRIQEVSSVVVLSLAVTVTAYLIAGFRIERSLLGQIIVIGAVISALAFALTHIDSTAPEFD